MISQEYLHLEPVEEYVPFNKSGFFIGTKIKNRYDELRINIDPKTNPKRYIFNQNKDRFFGSFIEPPTRYVSILKDIKDKRPFDLIGYSDLLNNYGLTCNKEFYKLNSCLYPVDYEHIKQFLPNYEYSTYLCLKPNFADFQSYAQPELFIIFID
jgi:hypothetical protein